MVIKEFLPNPAGIEKEGEYIKIFNNGNEPVSLGGWQIKDASGKIFKLSGNLNAGQELILPYSLTKIILNNDGERIFLYDASGNLVDELSYAGKAVEGQVIKFSPEGGSGSVDGELLENNQIPDYSITQSFIFIDFLTAAILAGLGLYIILELEKKLGKNLF